MSLSLTSPRVSVSGRPSKVASAGPTVAPTVGGSVAMWLLRDRLDLCFAGLELVGPSVTGTDASAAGNSATQPVCNHNDHGCIYSCGIVECKRSVESWNTIVHVVCVVCVFI